MKQEMITNLFIDFYKLKRGHIFIPHGKQENNMKMQQVNSENSHTLFGKYFQEREKS